MSAFQKPPQAGLLDYSSARSLNDGSFSNYQGSYLTSSLVPSPMPDQASQISDGVSYLASHEYASSYGEAPSPMLNAESRQLPEINSYSPIRGPEGTKVFVEIQTPYDLHNTPYAHSYLVFGSKKCECIPHFVGFNGPNFTYALSVEAPQFIATGCPSFAVPLQVAMGSQDECAATTLQVGVYTYEQPSHPSPSDESRKRRMESFSDNTVPRPSKRCSVQQMPANETPENYQYQDHRSASYSPYVQSLPTMNGGFVTPYHAAPSPRVGQVQYSTVSATPQPSIRAPSPLTPSWSPSFVPVSSDVRNSNLAIAHSLRQQKPSSPAGRHNPTLIRTSTLQHGNGIGQTQTFNPYAIYPSKAILKLNGDLDSMTENWSKEERDAKRRLVQFTRMQSGSTIHADFKPVAPEDRAPNSICISCIHWDGKDECFVTSVDTIYLLESLVGVRFTVEEKNRIRRNLEGFRPLTVSKAKQDSEDFFKVIMGFPAPKPRNIEKDVKVFPWKILSHALKKIIGKYSASYSSTAAALPTPIGSNYASNGTGSDSGTEHNAGSPQSMSDTAPSSTYGPSMATPAYSPHTDHSVPPMNGAPELRTVLPAVSQPYHSVPAPYAYPTVCQQQSLPALTASVNRASWDLNSLVNHPASAPQSTYNYMGQVPYPLHDQPHGP
ncbi:hypothetical protein ASPWEDRAFT_31346 [Aspergillus wentii DTO 134E9]|uniref:DUF7082 domain-containing protein n=1 Tax=Aspergillus wentii DTO 134E9 TaxID=1073089 RepID=A0A1L9RBZ6_ASPWE|nr:uncharacterized protein ASPWEDRAFT_31346 [Aspergillus wentii DTO 134E9]OJJ32445.1 hypothetical protein ASPWEDRAFT_31346 [Aspergillus wentii DTO 134E9]